MERGRFGLLKGEEARKGHRHEQDQQRREVLHSVLTAKRRRSDLAVVPIEKSTAGNVGETTGFLVSSS